MSAIDDDCYANRLYHAVEEQLLRRQQLEQFIAKYSSTIPLLVFHTLASDNLPEMMDHQELENITRYATDFFSSIFDGMHEIALPYHDDVLFVQFCHDMFVQLDTSKQKKENKPRDSSQPFTGIDNETTLLVNQLSNIYPDIRLTQELSPLFHVYNRFFHSSKLQRYLIRMSLWMVKGGYKIDKLGRIYGTLHANTVLPPENGYTRIFRRGESVTLEQLRDELVKTNTLVQSNETWRDMEGDTVAISYRHFAYGSQQRISDRDLHAIHRFLVASQASNVRFWIDSKLPLTNDGTFERWLTRGVRPFARYCTLVCPSAFEEKKRYWIQMERIIAMAAQGIFYVTEDGVYFQKNPFRYRSLCHKMLTMMVGIDGIPPGMQSQDEGKVIQWALGFLGDRDSVRLFRLRGPRLDGLCNEEFSEMVAMQNITLLIREHGPLVLPVESGRSWNEDNPLVLKGIPHQKLILPTWIGFLNPRNPRKVVFLNGTTLPQVIYGGLVGLEVKLREKFVKGQKNEVIRKELRDIPHSELLQTGLVLDFSGIEKQETITSTNDRRLVVTAANFKGPVLQAIAKENGLANELKTCIQCLHELRQGEKVKEKVQDCPSRTLIEKEASNVPQQLLQLEMEGMEAITFPWECDWV